MAGWRRFRDPSCSVAFHAVVFTGAVFNTTPLKTPGWCKERYSDYSQISNIRFDVILVIYTEFALRCFSSAKGSSPSSISSTSVWSWINNGRKASQQCYSGIKTNCPLLLFNYTVYFHVGHLIQFLFLFVCLFFILLIFVCLFVSLYLWSLACICCTKFYVDAYFLHGRMYIYIRKLSQYSLACCAICKPA